MLRGGEENESDEDDKCDGGLYDMVEVVVEDAVEDSIEDAIEDEEEKDEDDGESVSVVNDFLSTSSFSCYNFLRNGL